MRIQQKLRTYANPARAEVSKRFFKTGKGEYGEGDVFLGITVPDSRKIAQAYLDLSFSEIQKLLYSKVHEERLVALVILTEQYAKGTPTEKKHIYDFYLRHAKQVNNWDLVDVSAYKIIGAYLIDKPRKILYKLAQSKNVWERRMAIVGTFAFIREGDFADTLRIAESLLSDTHDLIHKAVGWMLREVGKRDKKALVIFIQSHISYMPRTTLRYAIERFSKSEQKQFLQKMKKATK